jgi:hypothetical protein
MFFDSSDPKLLGYALYGVRLPDPYTGEIIRGDPLVDIGGRWDNDATGTGSVPGVDVVHRTYPDGALDWLTETYLVRFKRNPTTNLVYDLEGLGGSATITVVQNVETIGNEVVRNATLSVTNGGGSPSNYTRNMSFRQRYPTN